MHCTLLSHNGYTGMYGINGENKNSIVTQAVRQYLHTYIVIRRNIVFVGICPKSCCTFMPIDCCYVNYVRCIYLRWVVFRVTIILLNSSNVHMQY